MKKYGIVQRTYEKVSQTYYSAFIECDEVQLMAWIRQHAGERFRVFEIKEVEPYIGIRAKQK